MPQHFNSNGRELSFKYVFLFMFLKDSNVLMEETVPMDRRYSFLRLDCKMGLLLLPSTLSFLVEDVVVVSE